MKRLMLCVMLGASCLILAGAAERSSIGPDRVVVEGDSSSGAVITPVAPGEITEVLVVVPFHYHRVPMGQIDPMVNAGEDKSIVNEVGTEGEVEVISGPTILDGTTFSVTVRMPDEVGNWIASFTSHAIAQTDAWGREYFVSRQIQLRLSTRPPIEEYMQSIE